MKWKIILVVVVLALILAQMLLGPKHDPDAATAAPDAGISENAGFADNGLALTIIPPPAPEDVVGVTLGDGESAIRLRRETHGWSLPDRDNAPAAGDAIRRLTRSLLTGDRRPVPPEDSGKTGLENGLGFPVSLALENGGNYDVMVGLRPAAVYDAAYVRLPDGQIAIVSGDIRGDLGLWRNTPEARPAAAAWLEKRALAFDPSRAVRVEAAFPDHRVVFEKPPDGDWRPGDYVPGDAWSAAGLEAWLRDVADFQIADMVQPGDFRAEAADKTISLAITLDDGETKRVSVQPNHGGEGMLAITSDYPGRTFHLPEWRFRKCFSLLPLLFPAATPAFDVPGIRFIDVRQSGETVKIARRDGAWEAVALPYALNPAAVERLAHMVASWRPEDYAAPDFRRIRPDFGGPMLEVILDDGTVHQYRLAGRHPLFPWRYVTLDGKAVFSVTDAEAGVMFPGFADILDLGRVFRDVTLEDVDKVELSDAGGEVLAAFVRDDDGLWSVQGDGQTLGLLPGEYRSVLGDLLRLRVTGFYDVGRHRDQNPPQYHLRLTGKDGVERHAAFLQAEERDIPYLADGDRGYLADRADFQNWLSAAREAEHRLREAVRNAPPPAVEPADIPEEAEDADAVAAPGEPPESPAMEEAAVPEEPMADSGDDVPDESGSDDAAEEPDALPEPPMQSVPDAGDSEEIAHEPAADDVLIHMTDDVDVVGDVIQDVLPGDEVLVPEAASVLADEEAQSEDR